MGYQVAGLAAQYVADLREGGEPDRAGMAVLHDRQIHDGYPRAVGQLSQGDAAISEEPIKVYVDCVAEIGFTALVRP
jgi:hypothetical protein